jgi:DNA modification methylase
MVQLWNGDCLTFMKLIPDSCMGSGSTGVACVNTNRGFYGIELENTYYHIAADRIEEAEMQKGLW